MNREVLGVGLLVSLPVAVGVATGVLKQTLGSLPLLAGAAGLTAGGAVFGLVALAGRDQNSRDDPDRLRSLGDRLLPASRQASERDLLVGAGVGALVTVFLWYIPLSPLVGGAAAGYVQGGSQEDARMAGTLSGALVPVVVLFAGAVAFLFFGERLFGGFPFGPLVAVGVSVVAAVYTVVFGTVGGWIGGLILLDGREWGNEA